MHGHASPPKGIVDYIKFPQILAVPLTDTTPDYQQAIRFDRHAIRVESCLFYTA